MTVLQQIRSYYLHLLPDSLTNTLAARRTGAGVVTPAGIKAHPSPEDYFAERGQRRESVKGDEAQPAQGRLLSEQA